MCPCNLKPDTLHLTNLNTLRSPLCHYSREATGCLQSIHRLIWHVYYHTNSGYSNTSLDLVPGEPRASMVHIGIALSKLECRWFNQPPTPLRQRKRSCNLKITPVKNCSVFLVNTLLCWNAYGCIFFLDFQEKRCRLNPNPEQKFWGTSVYPWGKQALLPKDLNHFI